MDETAAATGRRIAEERETLGMTQTLLASLVGIDRDKLNKIEHGTRRVSTEEALRIAGVLGMDLEDFQPRREPVLQYRYNSETAEAKEAEALFHRFISNWEVLDGLRPLREELEGTGLEG